MTTREKFILGTASVLLLVLGAVAVWQRTRAHTTDQEMAQLRTDLALQRQESTLALAAIEAARGSYELARQLASDFFSGVQAEVGNAPPTARSVLQEILLQRDAMITALSRSDQQSAPQLVQLLIRYRIALGEPVGPQEPSPAPPPGAAPPPDSTRPG